MTVVSTFLESSLNFLSTKTLPNLVQSGKKAVSKFELTETQFEEDKIACKTHLEYKNY